MIYRAFSNNNVKDTISLSFDSIRRSIRDNPSLEELSLIRDELKSISYGIEQLIKENSKTPDISNKFKEINQKRLQKQQTKKDNDGQFIITENNEKKVYKIEDLDDQHKEYWIFDNSI